MPTRPSLRKLLLAAAALAACDHVTVTTVPVSVVELSPSDVSVVEGGSVGLTAVLTDEEGHVLSGRDITWSTDAGDVASVDASGTVWGVSEGVTSVRASAEGVAGTARVTVLRGPTVALSLASLEFSGSASGPDPEPQVVAVFNDGAGVLEGLSAQVGYGSGPEGWLTATLAATTAPTTLTVTATAEGLVADTYVGVVTVSGTGRRIATLTATFVVDESAAIIGASAESVSFSHVAGAPTPEPATITISNLGEQELTGLGAGISYEAGPSGWLAASLSPTTAPSTLLLTVDPDGLPTGAYEASVEISSSVALNSPFSIPVFLTVENPPPEIGLSPTSLDLAAAEGTTPTGARSVSVINAGAGELTGLTSTTTYSAGADEWLDVQLLATVAPTSLRIVADPSGLSPATYTAQVRVASPVAANSPQVLDVRFVVSTAPALIALTPTSIDLSVPTSSGSDRDSVSVTNAGSGALSGLSTAIEYAGSSSGWLSAALSGTDAPATIELTASGGGLSAGSYSATLFVSAATAVNNPQSVDVSFTVGAPPNAPSNLTATLDGTDEVVLTWTDNSSDEDQFRIERQADGGDWAQIAVASANATTARDVSIAPGSTYTYRVRACRTFACSSWSNEASVTAPVIVTPPAAPSGLTATPRSESRIDLAWNDESDNEDRFEIQWRRDPGPPFDSSRSATVGTDVTFFSVTGLRDDRLYQFRVRACNDAGCSDWVQAQARTQDD